MAAFEKRYEKFARQFTLNGAILYLLFFAFLCFLGASEIKIGAREHDKFYWYMGMLTLVLGIFGIVHAVKVIRSVVRHLIADSHPPTA